jgi:hypothetical protein
LILLERYEVVFRAGSGVFLILLAFSYLNLKKVVIHGLRNFGTNDPGIVTVWKIFIAF